MSARITYTDEPMGELKPVKDSLPPPEDLVLKDDNVKVTISLSRSSVAFFKSVAREHHTSYQKMIRRLMDVYAAQYRDRL